MENNTLKVNPDLYIQQRYGKASQFSVHPAVNQSASYYLSQNMLGDISANKSNNEQNMQANSYQTNSHAQKSPQNLQKFSNENINQAIGNRQKEPSFNQIKDHGSVNIKTSNPSLFNTLNMQGQTYNTFKGFFISIYIKKFVTILKQSSSILRFKQLAQQQFNIISDQASDYYYYYFSNRLNNHVSFFPNKDFISFNRILSTILTI